MKVKVLFFASCRDLVGRKELELEVQEGSTVGDLRRKLVQDFPKLERIEPRLLAAVNAEYVEPDATLAAYDEVALIPPVSGGLDVFEITEDKISPDVLFDRVRYDEDGAVVTFVGVVRNNSMGKRTCYLEYEAYEEMAKGKLREIGEEIRGQWGIERVGIMHRVGRLEIGEISVVISVASPHRAEAFEACRYAIDRIKEVVPIWKREVWEDGERWIEG